MIENMRYPQAEESDDQAIEKIIREHQEGLRKYVRRRIVSRQDAEDVASQVMCDFLESCRRRPGVRHYVPLLFTIARHRVTDYFRTQAHRRREVSLDAEHAPQVAAPRSMLYDIEIREELREVMAVIDGLREEDREMMTFSAIVGLSAEEIAAIVGTSSGAVRVRLHFARKKFKRLLNKHHHGNSLDQQKD